MSKRIFIGIFLMFSSQFLLIGQYIKDTKEALDITYINQPHRIEFEYAGTDVEYFVVTAGDNGLLVLQETQIRNNIGFVWFLHMLDTALNVVWKKDIVIKYGTRFLGHDFNQNNFFMLFGTSQYKPEEMSILKIDIDGASIEGHNVNTVLPLTLSHFEVLGNGLIFGGQASGKPVVVFYDLNEKRPRVLPGIFNNKSSIVSIETSDRFDLFSVMVSEQMVNKDFSISLRIFSGNGDLKHTSTIKTEMEKSLIDAVSSSFSEGMEYIAGTYSNRKSEISSGIYLSKIRGAQQEFIRYHNYAELSNFFSYLKAARADKIKKKLDRKKIRGKSIKLNYRLLVHEMVKRGDEYILIGEAYYPKYSSTTYASDFGYSPYSYQNSNQTPSAQRFIGYQYTHAIVIGFNGKGEIVWDNSFAINDVLLQSLEENVQVIVESDRIILLYAIDNTIRTKVIMQSEMIEEEGFESIRLKYPSDEVKKENRDIEGLKEWYDNTLYVFGTQRIKNTKDSNVSLNRRVFYINKVSLN